MTDQQSKCAAFKALHVKGAPLVLTNIWDAGSAKAVAEAGAQAIATGSWAVAAAQGFEDGEMFPIEAALNVARQIVSTVEQPVSVDFEGGYAVAPNDVARNVTRLIETGVAGLNFEDRIVGGEGLHNVSDQAARIAAIRAAATAANVDLFINARTDVFFCGDTSPVAELAKQVIERATAYAAAGADGIFVPGLSDLDVIAEIAQGQELPLNVMRMGDAPGSADLAQAGVARISHGPGPYLAAMKALSASAHI